MRGMKKLMSVMLSVTILSSMFSFLVHAENTYVMNVNEGIVVKTSDEAMFGLNTDWSIGNVDKLVVDAENNNFAPTLEAKALFSRSEIPIIRLGEAMSQHVLWKDMVGDFEARPEYTLWGYTGAIKFGLVEKIKYFQQLNPHTEFIITINMNDTADNAADLAEFLTGDSSTTWGAKRIEYGIANPVPVRMYQLGNENDYAEPIMTAESYISKATSIINAITAKDTDAVFGAIGGTSMYTRYLRTLTYEDDWLKAVAAGLKDYIDYVTFNWYYNMGSTYEIDNLLDLVNASILEATGENKIKVCFTETACSVYGDPPTVPYNLYGVLTSADFYIRSYLNPNVKMSAYHAINSSSWKYLWVDDNKQCGFTGIGMLYSILKEYGCGDVLSSTLTGFQKGVESDIAGVAISPDNNKINLIYVNHKNEEVTINLNLGDYRKVKETVLYSKAGTPALTDVTDDSNNKIDMYSYEYTNGVEISSYTLPAYSVCAVALEKEISSEKVIYSDAFTDSSSLGNYTFVLSEDAELYGLGVSIEDGALKLDGFGDDGTTYSDNYIYLPNSVSTLDNYTLSANVSVENYDYGYFGVIFNASETNDFLSAGDGNVVLINSEGISEQQYAAGEPTSVVATTTKNAPSLENGTSFALKLTVSNGKISFFIDDKEVYSRNSDSQDVTGNMGFIFSDLSVSVDNLSITAAEEKVTISRAFTYEEDFNDIEDGKLPENFEITSGVAKAYVENGSLIIDNKQWYQREGVRITGLKNVAVQGLIMEADMTVISINEDARANKASNHGGFMYGDNGKSRGTSGLQAFASNLEFRNGAGSLVKTQAITYSDGETAFNEGGTVSVKMIFDKSSTPTVYINGTLVNYTKATWEVSSIGNVGLFVMASKIKFDNIRITGKQVYEFSKEAIENKNIDFTYSENFDTMANGTLPEGWIFINEDGREEYATAEVRDKALYLYSRQQYNYSTYLLFDYDKVLRPGLTMECDITRLAVPSGNTNNAHVGLMYAVDYDEETGKINNASYVAPYTAKEESSSAIAIRDFKATGADANMTVCTTQRYYDAEGNPLQFNWATREKPVHLKIVLTNETQSPVIYVDGVQVKYNRLYSDAEHRILSGKIGLYAFNSTVSIDNIKISGTQNVNVPVGTETYEAMFKNSTAEFASIEDAEENIVLNKKDFFGNVTDITADARIITTLVEGNRYVTTVIYDEDGDGINEYEKELNWTCLYFDEDFQYEENFDTMANGTLPEGWIFINEDGRKEYATAEVRDKALYLYSRQQYNYSTYLLFDYDKVLRPGLTMECDITRLDVPSGNTNNAHVGLMYAVDYDEETGKINNASYVAPYTAKEESSSAIAIRDFKATGADANMTVCTTQRYYDAEGNPLQFNWATREKPVHLKIVLTNETQSPVIYVDGVQVKHNRLYSDAEHRILSGKIGLYAFNSTVSIDNIKISGKTRSSKANDKNQISVLNFNFADGKLEATVRLKKTDLGDKKAFLAVYNKTDKQLVNMSELKDWNGNVKDYRTSIKVEGVEDFSLDKYDVSIFAWDINNLVPVCRKVYLE